MLAVSNTSPISSLAIIGRLEFLRRRYAVVHIPPAVADELGALTHASGSKCIQAALSERWLVVEPLGASVPQKLPFPLDRGETEAILLACQLNADVLLMDEKRGREAARQRGLVVAGVLGELIHAKLAGWIPNVRDEIRRLRVDAGFFVDATVERFILSQVGE
jgi:predicted nucleic acid-binding protein